MPSSQKDETPKLPSFPIPHAKQVYGEGVTLHVVTDLMHNSDSPGFNRQKHDELMRGVALASTYSLTDHPYVGPHFVNYVIHSPDQP